MSELAVGSISGLAANGFVVDVASGSSLDLSNGATLPSGNVINSYSAQMSAVQSFSSTSNTWVDLTNLSITLTPQSSSSKFLIFANVYMQNTNGGGQGLNKARILRDGSALESAEVLYSPVAVSNTITMVTVPVFYNDIPNTSSSITYKVQATQAATGGTETVYINRHGANDLLRAKSFLTIQEIAG